jgi:hypothetical protein
MAPSYLIQPSRSASGPSNGLDAALEAEEEDNILAAKSLFDMKEYSRAYKVLRACQSSKALFICHYSHFLVSNRAAIPGWEH